VYQPAKFYCRGQALSRGQAVLDAEELHVNRFAYLPAIPGDEGHG